MTIDPTSINRRCTKALGKGGRRFEYYYWHHCRRHREWRRKERVLKGLPSIAALDWLDDMIGG